MLISLLVFPCLFYIKSGLYTPIIKGSVSTDSCKTFTQNGRQFPFEENIYLKYEVSVKTRAYWWLLLCKTVKFKLEYPVNFELCEYTNVSKIKGPEKFNEKINQHNVSISEIGNEERRNYVVIIKEKAEKVCIQDKGNKETEFSVIASDKPQKAELIFKLLYHNNDPNIFKLKKKSCRKWLCINKTTLYTGENTVNSTNSKTEESGFFQLEFTYKKEGL
jgi:hypothetical protein